ncbi:MAG: hypothetical protein E7426_04615 [Ruminococcaceae bacterium]|jgi:L-serine dehydratase|nr:hypothetical protein [Oscillospiraceae bacterium]
MAFYPSIFNDCLSPVYPGPSSSNTAAPYRLGIIATDLLDGKPTHLHGEMSKGGGYFATFYGLHSDKGFLVGILRKDMLTYDYERSYEDAAASGLTYTYEFTDNVPVLPSEAAWLTLTSDTGDKLFVKTVSQGGGEIYIDDLDGFKTYIDGKYYYLLVRVATEHAPSVEAALSIPFSRADGDGGESLITAHSREPYRPDFLARLRAMEGVVYARCADPVYDIIPIEEPDMPFTDAKGMFAYAARKNIPLWQAALDYEKAISGLNDEKLMRLAENLWDVAVRAAEEGYKVTAFDGAIVKPHAAQFRRLCEEGRAIPLGIADRAAVDALSVKEYGAAHGVIVGMPAGGAAGVPVSTIRYAAETLGKSKEDGLRALMVAAILGIFYYPTHYHGAWGCQAEVGISISITAGALASLLTDDLDVIERAAVLGAQSILGQVCDPIDGAGQVPCLLRNITAVPTAIACANAALGGVETLTSLDEMAETLLRVGLKLKEYGINDLGVCYCKTPCDTAAGCSDCGACGS